VKQNLMYVYGSAIPNSTEIDNVTPPPLFADRHMMTPTGDIQTATTKRQKVITLTLLIIGHRHSRE
jgi:hypothetical protein